MQDKMTPEEFEAWFNDPEHVKQRAARSLWENPFENDDNKMTPQQYQAHLNEIYKRTPEYAIRDADWTNLLDEQQAVRGYYKEKDRPVPLATERRFEKQIAEFKEHWNIEKPKIPLNEWKTMNEHELNSPFQSWRDLMASHNLIEHHYAIAGHAIPEATVKRQIAEIAEYDREMAAYQMSQAMKKEFAREAPSANNEANQFKEQIETLRKQQQQKPLRPR